MTGKPETLVLLDTENLFFPFGYPLRKLDKGKLDLLDRHFPAVPHEVAITLAELAVHDMVDWLDDGFDRGVSSSYGWPENDIVKATRESLVGRGFTHFDVPKGKDEADRAVKNALEMALIGAPTGHATLGGEDHLVLDYAAKVAGQFSGAWQFLVIVPDITSCQVPKFAQDRKYGGLELASLDIIREARSEQRKQNPEGRVIYRRQVTRLIKAHVRPMQLTPAGRLLAVVEATIRIDGLRLSEAGATQRWNSAMIDKLVSHAVPRTLAQAVVAWVGVHADEVRAQGIQRVHELLFRAAIDVCLDGLLLPETVRLLRGYTRKLSADLQLAFERAVVPFLRPAS